MNFTGETTFEGVTERSFEVVVAGECVPGVVWVPEGAAGSRPLVLMGHGGSQNKKFVGVLKRAQRYVKNCGFAVAAIDAPGHGERPRMPQIEQFVVDLQKNMAEGKSVSDIVVREMARLALQTVPEWQAALDTLETLAFIGKGGPVGYLGFSMGGATGVSLVAAEPRIKAAVLGLAGLLPGYTPLAEAAARISVPVEFVMQWQDELVPREASLALFDAFGSLEKSLHANPGGHVVRMPVFEEESWERFFRRHLL